MTCRLVANARLSIVFNLQHELSLRRCNAYTRSERAGHPIHGVGRTGATWNRNWRTNTIQRGNAAEERFKQRRHLYRSSPTAGVAWSRRLSWLASDDMAAPP